MHIREHSSGKGWNYRLRVRDFLRELLGGAAHINRYISKKAAPTKRDADKIGNKMGVEDTAVFDYLESLPAPEQRAFVAKGGLKAIRERLIELRELHNWMRDIKPDEFAQSLQPGPTIFSSKGQLALAAFHLQDQARDVIAPQIAEYEALIDKADGVSKTRQIGNSLRDLFEHWCQTPLQQTGRPPQVTRGHKASVERFIRVCGDLSVKHITKAHIRKFYAANEAELPNSPSSRVKHRDHIKALLSLAVSVGWRDDNPADNIRMNVGLPKLADGNDKDGKKPFSPAQLQMLLEAARRQWAAEGLLALKILIYAGLRSNECAQLRSDDIATVDGIHCLRVRSGRGQSVKNKPSRRLVPLHREIATEVLARVAGGHEWLFPSFPHDNPKQHKRWLAAHFNGRFDKQTGKYEGLLRGVCGITDPDLTLHSIRHSFKDACRRARIDPETRKELMGHGKGCVNEEYGDEMLELMKDAIDEIDPLSPELKPRVRKD